ncbi:hypothetical protein [uncultured Hoeflea sp.]|uniref:hypothetical protein n=1 Tax=uncultured Hoeflea sp. TaxID=538666 RepID=UPI002622AE2A|nr:hypothetical protein [uncultured Hoeflea sp.]
MPDASGRKAAAGVRKDGDAESGMIVTDRFERFAQRNDILTRSLWNPEVRSKKTNTFFASYGVEAASGKGDGF